MGLDFVGPLLVPCSKAGTNFLPTVVDYKTQVTHFILSNSDPDASKQINNESTAKLSFMHALHFHRLPAVLLTNSGDQCMGEFFSLIFRIYLRLFHQVHGTNA